MRCRIEQPSEQRNFPHCPRLDGWMSTAINNQSCCRCHWDAVGIRITIALKLRRLKRPEINGPESRRQLEGLVIRRRRISSVQHRTPKSWRAEGGARRCSGKAAVRNSRDTPEHCRSALMFGAPDNEVPLSCGALELHSCLALSAPSA